MSGLVLERLLDPYRPYDVESSQQLRELIARQARRSAGALSRRICAPTPVSRGRRGGGRMSVRLALIAVVLQVASLGVAAPGMASSTVGSQGHTGSVVFAESGGDAARRVGQERQSAPRAGVDIVRAQFTQTDGLLTLTLETRRLGTSTLDRLAVNLDTDGDLRPDQGLRWSRPDQQPTLVQLDGRFRGAQGIIACDGTEVLLEPAQAAVTVMIDRDCLIGGEQPAVRNLQVAAYDKIDQTNPNGEHLRAKWDFLGGPAAMVAIPF